MRFLPRHPAGDRPSHVSCELARVSCGTCHGTGYSKTTVNTATHNNGVVNIASGAPGWNPTTRSCSNSCHGTQSWGGSTTSQRRRLHRRHNNVGSDRRRGALRHYCSRAMERLPRAAYRGATVAQIQTGINTISGMMSLSTLTSAQIQAISTALGNSTSSTTTPTPSHRHRCAVPATPFRRHPAITRPTRRVRAAYATARATARPLITWRRITMVW